MKKDDLKCEGGTFRLRAWREYTGVTVCSHNPPHKSIGYCVTFGYEKGLVVTDAHFTNKADADFVVDAVNKRFDELGPPIEHRTTWSDEDESKERATP